MASDFLAVLGSESKSQIPLTSLSNGQMLEESIRSFKDDVMGCWWILTLSLLQEAMKTILRAVGLEGCGAISNLNHEVRLKQESLERS